MAERSNPAAHSVGRILGLTRRTTLCVFVLLAITPVRLQADIDEVVVYYSIYGNSLQALGNEISRKGPNGFTGYTDSDFNYRFTTFPAGSRCSVASFSIDVTITYTLPKWEDQNQASSELQDAWNQSFAALDRHERQHGSYAKDTYEKIIRDVRAIGFRDSCDEVRRVVTSTYDNAMASNREQNRNYDRITDHGRTEGVDLYTRPGDSVVEEGSDGEGPTLIWYLLGGLILGLLYFIRR